MVNGMPQAAGGLERGQPARGHLVGRAAVARQVVAQRLEHHPLAGRHLGQQPQLVLVQRAGVGVGQQAVSSSTSFAIACR